MVPLILCLVLALGVPPAFATGQKGGTPHGAPGPRPAVDHPGKHHHPDHPPVLIQGGGGGQPAPYGKTCKEARERMHWSTMPCSPDMPLE